MKKNIYIVPVKVTSMQYIKVEATNKEEAKEKVKKELDIIRKEATKEGAIMFLHEMANGDESMEKFKIAKNIPIVKKTLETDSNGFVLK